MISPRIERLKAIARSSDEEIRRRIAEFRLTPGEILTLLSQDAHEQVRLSVAKNPSTPHHIVARLARDQSVLVRCGLAADINTPVELIIELAEDSEPVVREAAKATRRQVRSSYEKLVSSMSSDDLSLRNIVTHRA